MRLRRSRHEAAASGSIRESGLGATALVPGEPRQLARAGRTPRCRPSSWATTCASFARCSTRYGYDGALYGHFGAGLRAHPHQLRPHAPGGIANVPRRSSNDARTSCVRYGGSLSGEHGDGQARGELLPEDVRPRADATRSASSRPSGIPTGQMNPGKVVDPVPRRRRTCGSAPRYRSPAVEDALSLSRRRRQLRAALPSAASASGECRREREAAPCARATWSRAKSSTRRAAARTCCSR